AVGARGRRVRAGRPHRAVRLRHRGAHARAAPGAAPRARSGPRRPRAPARPVGSAALV
ncbi:MAG: hypothetical protein AVDCRST_MAG85-4079, partial [uncultured Solirubrobacteraceae bacterium]